MQYKFMALTKWFSTDNSKVKAAVKHLYLDSTCNKVFTQYSLNSTVSLISIELNMVFSSFSIALMGPWQVAGFHQIKRQNSTECY